MTDDIRGVLLVPIEAGGEVLLGAGHPRIPCFPPTAWRSQDGVWAPGRYYNWQGPRDPVPHGLALWWDGKPVPDGVFRAWDAWSPDGDQKEFEATGWTTYDVLAESLDSLRAAEWLARSLERCGLGHVILLDADGREQGGS
jgi:hypothetical protein